ILQVEANETDQVKVYPAGGGMDRGIQITVTTSLNKEENGDPDIQYAYETDLPQNANALVYDTVFERAGYLGVPRAH
ncbi:hypothetical protein Tco_0063768, partial [Tanacetum coccineum]